MEVSRPRRFHDVTVSLKAHTSVLYRVGDGTYVATGTREYFNFKFLWNREQARDGKFPSGRHNFRFQFTIPNQRLLYFFDRGGSLGYIRYYVEGRIGVGRWKFDHITEAECPLVEVADINISELQRPIRREVEKTTTCCWLYASGPITLTAESSRRGYCIGEAIPLTVTVENASTK